MHEEVVEVGNEGAVVTGAHQKTAPSLSRRTRTTRALEMGAAPVPWSLLASLGTHEQESSISA